VEVAQVIEALLVLLGPYLPYIVGFLIKAALDAFGIKIPALPGPAPAGPDGEAPADRPLLNLLKLLLKARTAPAALSEKEKDTVAVVWDATPDERPK
jgi:hypothetical protein